LHAFPKAFFLGVDMEYQLGDEEVWSPRLEYGVKIAITFDHTIRSCSSFCTRFWRLFSLGLLWNRYTTTRRSGRPDLSNGQNGHNFRSDHRITLKVLHEFSDALFLGVALESQLGDEEVLSARLEKRTKWPNF